MWNDGNDDRNAAHKLVDICVSNMVGFGGVLQGYIVGVKIFQELVKG